MSDDKICMFGSVPMKTTFVRLMNQSRCVDRLYIPALNILVTFMLFHSACHESLASQQLIRANSKKY